MKQTSPQFSRALTVRLARIKLLLCDVDGVLTDGSVSIGPGAESKRFNIQDGLGLRLLQQCGIQVGWISNRPSPATASRAAELRVDFLFQDKSSKVDAAQSILKQTGLDWSQICYLGDDVVDLGVMRRAGASVAVANAIEEVKRVAHYTTRLRGGEGAVREVVELILKAQHKWKPLIRTFSS